MSRFRKLSHTIWHCHYPLVWTPKYRYRILAGEIKQEVEQCIRAFTESLKCELVELNIQADHVHVLVLIPPKVSVSYYVGTVKGRTAIRVLNRFRQLRRKPYWGEPFLGTWLLCRHGRFGHREDTGLRQVSGTPRSQNGTKATVLIEV